MVNAIPPQGQGLGWPDSIHTLIAKTGPDSELLQKERCVPSTLGKSDNIGKVLLVRMFVLLLVGLSVTGTKCPNTDHLAPHSSQARAQVSIKDDR